MAFTIGWRNAQSMDETLGGALSGQADVPCINACEEKQ